MPKIDKIKEKGVAEVIEGSEGTEKYLALHRTAKIGTIMQVRNDLNDQIVFVRVLGKLPNTGVDGKVIIRISKKAFEKLGGVDYKFPVEISYLPLKD
jgi:rare lipoprotein A (peptidoglycan hydrolase)